MGAQKFPRRERRSFARRNIKQDLQPIGSKGYVVVENSDPLRVRRFDSSIHSRRETKIPIQLEDTDPIWRHIVLSCELGGAVGRAVVHHDDFIKRPPLLG